MELETYEEYREMLFVDLGVPEEKIKTKEEWEKDREKQANTEKEIRNKIREILQKGTPKKSEVEDIFLTSENSEYSIKDISGNEGQYICSDDSTTTAYHGSRSKVVVIPSFLALPLGEVREEEMKNFLSQVGIELQWHEDLEDYLNQYEGLFEAIQNIIASKYKRVRLRLDKKYKEEIQKKCRYSPAYDYSEYVYILKGAYTPESEEK